MPAIAIILIGFVGGLFTMMIVSLYKWMIQNLIKP